MTANSAMVHQPECCACLFLLLRGSEAEIVPFRPIRDGGRASCVGTPHTPLGRQAVFAAFRQTVALKSPAVHLRRGPIPSGSRLR